MAKTLTVLLFLGVLSTTPQANAGSHDPDTNFVYVLTLSSSNAAYKLTSSDEKWQKSLLTNLHALDWTNHPGSMVKTFVLSTLTCSLNGTERLRVYIDRDDPNVFYVDHATTKGAFPGPFIVDLNTKWVVSPYAGGDSEHPHPKGNFIVILTSASHVGGVGIRDISRELTSGTVTWW